MSPAGYQVAPITCPACQYRFTVPVLTIIDTHANPEAKALFLSGQLNVAACPQCGQTAVLSAPLVYHDPDKELLFTYLPPHHGTSEFEQQRFIGDLTTRLISALPAEQRKGYLLQPRTFLRLEAMVQAILEADGITPEMQQAQRARAALLERLVQTPDEEIRHRIATENDASIDYEFLQLLALNAELAEASGRAWVAQQLEGLRQQLLEWTTAGREVAAREEAIRSLGENVTRESLLERLVEAALADEQVKVETMVAVARPAIDYLFYQQLTQRIEAAERTGGVQQAQTLRKLRETVLDLTAEIDAEVQQATEEAGRLLGEILAAPDLEAALRENAGRVDGLFLDVLAASLQAAERGGQAHKAERLRAVRDAVLHLIQESQPPQIDLINRLLGAEYPDGSRLVLEENREQIDAELIEIMDIVRETLLRRGQAEAADRLGLIREQAADLANLPDLGGGEIAGVQRAPARSGRPRPMGPIRP